MIGRIHVRKLLLVIVLLLASGPWGFYGPWQHCPGWVFADGAQTGTISGVVSDLDGVAVQGVEVVLQGPQGTRRAITDTAGRFRFPALGLGAYELKATLLDLIAVRTGVTVFAGRTTEAQLVLRDSGSEPAVEDWIQVVGRDAPLVDRFDTRVGTNLTFDLLDDLPVERFYQSFALLLPGVSGGRDGNPNTSGALRSANLFLVDGVDTTDPTTGLFGLNLSYESVQEVQVTTAAPGVEFGRVSGAVINVVTRSGGRDFSGVARWVIGGDDWSAPFEPGPDRVNLGQELATANSGRSDLDSALSLAVGGPLVTDRLWFFTSYQDSSVGALRPTLLGEPWNVDSDVQTQAAKLTWQATDEQSVVGQFAGDDADFTVFEPFSRGPSELELPDVPGSGQLGSSFFQTTPGESFALGRRGQRGSFAKLQWNAALGQNLSLAVNLADQDRRITRGPLDRRGLTDDAPHVGAFLDPTAPPGEDDNLFLFLFNGVTEEGVEERPRKQANLAVDLFRTWGSTDHDMRFGFDYQETKSVVDVGVPGAPGVDPFTGRPVGGQLYVDFDLSAPCLVLQVCAPFDPSSGEFRPVGLFNFYLREPRSTSERAEAVYWADSMALDRWLIYLGVRWQGVDGRSDQGVTLVDERVVAPRFAVTYDFRVGNNARDSPLSAAVLSATWGRFHEGFLHQYLDAYHRLEPISGFTEYERLASVPDGPNGSTFDCSQLTQVDLSSPCWVVSEVSEVRRLLPATPNASLDQTAVDEWTLGLETRFGDHSSLSVFWVDRQWRDLWNGVERFVPAEDRVFTEVRNLPEGRREYQALQVLFRKRLARGWQLLASYTWSDAQGNFFTNDGLDSFADFGDLIETNLSGRQGPAPYDRPHQAGLFTTFHWPVGSSHLTLGSALTYRDGVPFQFETLNEAGLQFLTPRGSSRLSGVWQWDLAADLEFDWTSWATFELRAEVRNLTDEQQVMGVETLVDTGLAGFPTGLDEVQAPRTFRLTLGLRF